MGNLMNVADALHEDRQLEGLPIDFTSNVATGLALIDLNIIP
jgi:hypothetical protein